MTIDVFPQIVHENDLSPDEGYGAEFDEAVEDIVKACKGFGSNAKKCIEVIGGFNADDRYKLSARFKELEDGKTLCDLMQKEMSGNFGQAMQFMSLPPHEAECAMIKAAAKGVGSHAMVLMSILCGRTNVEMEILKKTYFRMYTRDLGKLLASELHGDNERLIFNCLQASEEEYDPQFHTLEKAAEDAETIQKQGKKMFVNEREIFKIICASPPEHLENINTIYADKFGYALWKAMEKDLCGNAEKACIHLVNMKLKPYEAVAKLIKTACAGMGTDELLLTTCIVRYQYIMNFVQPAHIELFSKSIQDRIRSECRAKYRDILLAATNTAWPEG
eukprot:CAMPEP_0194131386 /NCGR_PEP_ID=MMETSP0152-20130528/2170_1 /TAXON_ID=1049557 /ORGANISM="Thalassiothrix antarctica, Strain L6-D1" /LENGTH=332 /DNA_ID=CAMNT_0038826155 /DNA_START=29 /DNA_END=1027 /DNA_ORIENTATION=-